MGAADDDGGRVSPDAGTEDEKRARRERSVRENREAWRHPEYFREAEVLAERQWNEWFRPVLEPFAPDLACVLELAPGHGRMAERMAAHAKELHLVDATPECVAACRARFEGRDLPARIHCHQNDGTALPMLADGAITFFYCWDAMVHFDPEVIEAYLHELARVLAPGALGAAHHSNWAALAPGGRTSWRENPHHRSWMSREHFARLCAAAGLVVEASWPLDWEEIPRLDAVTVFRKPAGPAQAARAGAR